METFFEAQPELIRDSAIALGFFDGVHPGHQAVIGKALEEARRLGVPCGIVTFKDHPRTLTRGKSPLLLTVIDQRLNLFSKMGVDFALALNFTEELCKLSPFEYVESILVGSLGARSISVGPNHHFGRDREGDAQLLTKMGTDLNFVVHVAEMVTVAGTEVSSSKIRELIQAGEMDAATSLLSRPFALHGKVVEGDKRGKQLGFPTCNLELYEFQVVPRRGVYAGMTSLKDGRTVPSVINIGLQPTFNRERSESEEPETKDMRVEAHLLDFQGDLYDQMIEVQFHKYLRGEKRFDGPESLKKQIAADIETAKSLLSGPGDEGEPKELRNGPHHKLFA